MTPGQFLQLVAGLAMLGTAGIAWSGRWRSWAHSPWLRSVPITAVPALGLLLVFNGLRSVLPPPGVNALGVLMALGLFSGALLSPSDPAWFGPRWYRRFKRSFAEGFSGSLAWMAQDLRRQGESTADATFRHQTAFRPQPPSNRVRLVSRAKERVRSGVHGKRGVFVYYPQAPVWAAGIGEDGVLINDIIAAEIIQDAQKLSPGKGLDGRVRRAGWRSYLVPRVRVDTTEGSWLFESRKAKYLAREIDYRYLDPSRDMYGMPLDDTTPAAFKKGAVSTSSPEKSTAGARFPSDRPRT